MSHVYIEKISAHEDQTVTLKGWIYNIRSSGKDDAIRLTPPRIMTLEQAIAYIDDDELVEVTPKTIRLRKRYLDPNERKRMSRSKAA